MKMKKFQNTAIDPLQFDNFKKWGMSLAKKGDPTIESLRVVFKIENDPYVYMYSLLDYIDYVPAAKITSLYLYQIIDE